jgi:hypothetical protein
MRIKQNVIISNMEIGISVEYTSDTMGYPMNPMGRTGARGRGALWRWGPNHEINAVLTRWKKNKEDIKSPLDSKYMSGDGQRMLEFLACRDSMYGEWKLPGVFEKNCILKNK